MLRYRSRRLAARGALAVKRLIEIEASIASLKDDDLLDLADIFRNMPLTPLAESAFSEMAKRELSL